MKKAALKLIPALCMLLISAMMLGTTTYAWFSMNNAVQATGLKISARNASGTLLIAATKKEGGSTTYPNTAAAVQAANQTSVNLGQAMYFNAHNEANGNTAVQPSAHAAATTSSSISVFEDATNWHYQTSANASSSVASSAVTGLTDFTGYVLRYQLFITVAASSPNMGPLTVSSVTITGGGSGGQNVLNGYRVVIASDTASDEFYLAHYLNSAPSTQVVAKNSSNVHLAETVTHDDVVEVWVYIYLDGEDVTTYTNNFANLAEASIDIVFNGGAVSSSAVTTSGATTP